MKMYAIGIDYPIYWKDFPDRIRLSDGSTKTDKSTFSDSDIVDAGWTIVDELLYEPRTHIGEWDYDILDWNIRPLTDEELVERAQNVQNEIKTSFNYEDYKHQLEQRENTLSTGSVESEETAEDEPINPEEVLYYRNIITSFESDLSSVTFDDGIEEIPLLEKPPWVVEEIGE